jgi:hypothetical protein
MKRAIMVLAAVMLVVFAAPAFAGTITIYESDGVTVIHEITGEHVPTMEITTGK